MPLHLCLVNVLIITLINESYASRTLSCTDGCQYSIKQQRTLKTCFNKFFEISLNSYSSKTRMDTISL